MTAGRATLAPGRRTTRQAGVVAVSASFSASTTTLAPGQRDARQTRSPVAISVAQSVDETWMVSDEKPLRAVTTPVPLSVDQTWMNSEAGVVHMIGSWHPPHTDDVRPSCCGCESLVTPGGCRLNHTVHRLY